MEQLPYRITYELKTQDGHALTHYVDIDPATLLSAAPSPTTAPSWTKLSHQQCEGCTYKDSEHCPIALRIAKPVEIFDSLVSHTRVTATVTTPERTYVKETDAQEAIRSLFGLIMATSGCPSMQDFKFMARHHLPFSTIEETISRFLCTYLLGQFFRHPHQEPEKPHTIPVNLSHISSFYATIQKLNDHMARRLKNSDFAEGATNAVIIFSAYSSLIPMMLDKELRKLRNIFIP